MTQNDSIRLGKRTDNRAPKVKDFVSLAPLADIEFGGWDLFPENAYEAAVHAEVLDRKHLDPIKDELSAIVPMKAAFDPVYVKRLHGTHVKTYETKAEAVEQLRAEHPQFQAGEGLRPARGGVVRQHRNPPPSDRRPTRA